MSVGYQNEIRTPKNLWCHTSHDLFSMILFLTSRDKKVLEVTTSRIIWGQLGVSEWNQNIKNLWLGTSHDLFSLISYFDKQRSANFGDHDLQKHLRSKRGIRMESNTKNLRFDISHDLFSLIHYLTIFRGHYRRKVKWRSDICVNINTSFMG